MGKPTAEELAIALTEAKRMREHGEDPHYLAKALLNLNYRSQSLERVLEAVDSYFRSGQAEREHTRLVKAVQTAHQADDRSAGVEHKDLGLG